MRRHYVDQTPEDLLLASYTYDLPEELIAQVPPQKRGDSRLMVLDRETGNITSARFSDLASFLPPGILVANNSRVIPARIPGRRASGGKVEFLLLTPVPHIQPEEDKSGICSAQVQCLLKSSKQVRPGETISLGHDLQATILARHEYGKCTAKLSWRGHLSERLLYEGELPLPPYIKRPQSAEDAERYQTVYGQRDKAGSIAAPTAGLHFTTGMRQHLEERGSTWTEVTLYVGYGTFSPVRSDNILEHRMHCEYCEISPDTADRITRAKERGEAITAVGTTSARTLEGVAAQCGRVEPFQGWTDIFLYPGQDFAIVDHLLTNFHLPKSTLLMLVSAFAGREMILEAYAKAIKERYRFFSYGDAMLIL